MSSLEGKVLHATTGYNCTRNEFALILGETAKTVRVLRLRTKRVSGDLTDGSEVPVIPPAEERGNAPPTDVLRIQKRPDRADPKRTLLWGRGMFWEVWDGERKFYNGD